MNETERLLAACIRHGTPTPDAHEEAMHALADWLDQQGDHHDARDVRAVASLDLWDHQSSGWPDPRVPRDNGPVWFADIPRVASFRLTLGAKYPYFRAFQCGGWLLSVSADRTGTLDDNRNDTSIFREQFPFHEGMGDPKEVLAPYLRYAKFVTIAHLLRCPPVRLLAACAKAALAVGSQEV